MTNRQGPQGTETVAVRRAENWRDRAACKGAPSAVFFPPRGDAGTDARATCHGCPVTVACLASSLLGDQLELGIWGGLSGQERKHLAQLLAARWPHLAPDDGHPVAAEPEPTPVPVHVDPPMSAFEARARRAATESANGPIPSAQEGRS